MKRVRTIMKKNQKKMDEESRAPIQHINPTQKIIDLESELDVTKRQLSKFILK